MGVFVILPIAAALAVWFKRRFEIMVFPAIGMILLTLTITGMIGNLIVGVYLGLAYIVPAIVLLIYHKKQIGKYVLTPGLVAFCVYLVFFLLFSYGRYFISGRAMAQYGPSVLQLFKYDSLSDHSPYYNLTNPFPLGTLWAYFCSRIFGGYAEWKCIFAYDVMIISGILPVFYLIKTIKEEKWQWLVMILIGMFMPLLKMFNAYRSFDMVIPQTTAMVYTFYIVYRRIYGSERKGDTVFAAYGFFAGCTLTEYGMFKLLPLMVACCTVAFYNREKTKSLFQMLFAGCLPAFLLNLYNYLNGVIESNQLLFLPESLLIALVAGGIIACAIRLRNKGYQRTAMCFMTAVIMIAVVVTILLLKNSIYKEYVTEEIVELTNKLFTGTGEEEYVIGKQVIRIYDMTFLFILFVLSKVSQGKRIRKSKDGIDTSNVFQTAYIFGGVIYFLFLSVLYINVLRIPNANPVPVIASYVAPILVVSAAALLFRAARTWEKDMVLIVGGLLLLSGVYTDPVREVFDKPERDYVFPVLHDCIESGKISFTEKDRVFYMDPELFRELSVDFNWEVFPAGADAVSGLYFNADPYRWSGGEIQRTMTKEELADLIRDGGYTYVYLDNIQDFHINTYHTLFALVGPGMANDSIYHVEYDQRGQLKLRFIAQED